MVLSDSFALEKGASSVLAVRTPSMYFLAPVNLAVLCREILRLLSVSVTPSPTDSFLLSVLSASFVSPQEAEGSSSGSLVKKVTMRDFQVSVSGQKKFLDEKEFSA